MQLVPLHLLERGELEGVKIAERTRVGIGVDHRFALCTARLTIRQSLWNARCHEASIPRVPLHERDHLLDVHFRKDHRRKPIPEVSYMPVMTDSQPRAVRRRQIFGSQESISTLDEQLICLLIAVVKVKKQVARPGLDERAVKTPRCLRNSVHHRLVHTVVIQN